MAAESSRSGKTKMVALQLKYESKWAESYIYVHHLYRPFFWESLRDVIFSHPNDDSRYRGRLLNATWKN